LNSLLLANILKIQKVQKKSEFIQLNTFITSTNLLQSTESTRNLSCMPILAQCITEIKKQVF